MTLLIVPTYCRCVWGGGGVGVGKGGWGWGLENNGDFNALSAVGLIAVYTEDSEELCCLNDLVRYQMILLNLPPWQKDSFFSFFSFFLLFLSKLAVIPVSQGIRCTQMELIQCIMYKYTHSISILFEWWFLDLKFLIEFISFSLFMLINCWFFRT